MNRKTREELNELSKKVFGTSSRWQKLVNNGFMDSYEEENTKIIPNKRTGTFESKTFKTKKPIHRRYTLEQVRELMETILQARTSVPNTSVVATTVAAEGVADTTVTIES